MSIPKPENAMILGSGCCAIVTLRKFQGKYIAVKEFTTDREEMEEELEAIHKIGKGPNPNIAEYFGYNPDAMEIYMKYYPLTLKNSIFDCLDYDQVTPILSGLVKAVHYCNSKSVSHNDIKANNVLVNHFTPYLCDFGSTIQGGTKRTLRKNYRIICKILYQRSNHNAFHTHPRSEQLFVALEKIASDNYSDQYIKQILM